VLASGVVVLSRIDSVAGIGLGGLLLPWFATSRSGFPSPFTSATTRSCGEVPTGNPVGAPNDGVEDPGVVVLSRIDTIGGIGGLAPMKP
jgi:hypothetical protein